MSYYKLHLIDNWLKNFIYYFNFIISCRVQKRWEITYESDFFLFIYFFFFQLDLEGSENKS